MATITPATATKPKKKKEIVTEEGMEPVDVKSLEKELTIILPEAAKPVERLAVLIGDAPEKGVKYWEGAGNPPCFRNFAKGDKQCKNCDVADPSCESATAARMRGPTDVVLFHPKMDNISSEEANEQFKAVAAANRRDTIVAAIKTGAKLTLLYKELSKETFTEKCWEYLGWTYQYALRHVHLFEDFGHLDPEEAVKLIETFGSKEKAFIAHRAENPLAMAKSGEVTYQNEEDKVVTRPIAELSDKEFAEAIRAVPGSKTRKKQHEVHPDKAKGKLSTLIKKLVKPIKEKIHLLEGMASKSQGFTAAEMTMIKDYSKIIAKLAAVLETAEGKGEKAGQDEE